MRFLSTGLALGATIAYLAYREYIHYQDEQIRSKMMEQYKFAMAIKQASIQGAAESSERLAFLRGNQGQ